MTAPRYFLMSLVLLGWGILAAVHGQESDSQPAPGEQWLQELRRDGLAFSANELGFLLLCPDSLAMEKRRIAARYPEILSRIQEQRDRMRAGYAATPLQERRAREEEAARFINLILSDVLFPLWLGGTWDLNGTAVRPQSGPIACGWYLERILTAAGFQVAAPGGLHMAHLTCDDMVWAYHGGKTPNLRNWEGLKAAAEAHGPGVYLAGLDTKALWGHVLFLIHAPDGTLTFCHAGPSPSGTRVTYDDPEYYLKQFAPCKGIWAAQMDDEMARKWLTNEKLIPKKTKNY